MSRADHSVGLAGQGDAASVEVCYSAGLAALDRGELAEAEEWAARCDAAPDGAGDARCAMLRGAIAEETDDFDAATDHYRRAVEAAPNDALAARLLGRALMVSGELTQALAVLEDAARRAPDDANLLVDLGYVRARGGDGPGSVEAARRALALDSADGGVVRAAAQMYEAQGDFDSAAEVLAGAAREHPTARTLGDLARIYLNLDRYKEAEATFRALERVDPDHALVAQHGRAWCFIQLGDWRSALDVALDTTRLDRFDLTTAFLAYARDHLFGRVPAAEAARRQADLAARFTAELQEHYELHAAESDEETDGALEMGEGDGRG